MPMKYHPLSTKDLETNVEIFKAYLASEGIDAKMWEQIKKENSDKLASLISNFSTLFFESLSENYAYFKVLEGKSFTILHFRNDDYEGLSFIPDENKSLDKNHVEISGEIVYATKEYKKSKSLTISLHYHAGYRPCDKSEFNKLALLYAENRSKQSI